MHVCIMVNGENWECVTSTRSLARLPRCYACRVVTHTHTLYMTLPPRTHGATYHLTRTRMHKQVDNTSPGP